MDFAEYLDELSDPAKRVKVAGLQRLSYLSPEQAKQLAVRWPDINVRRRRRVISELQDLAEDNVEIDFSEAFRIGLSDDDAQVRLVSVRGLWENQDAKLIDRLLDLAERDDDARVRAEAALALGRFVLLHELGRIRERHFERVASGLRRVIEKPNEVEEVRARAIEAMGAHDAAWVRQSITEAYESGRHRLKVSSVHAMGRSAEPRWLPLLARELQSDEPELRYEAATAVGMLGQESAIPNLVALIVDEDEQVVAAAIGALGAIGGTMARRALRELLGSESAATRVAAADAIAHMDFEDDPLGFKVRD
ncbi:MAG TPA: HEAT repeat domain-containing protein [Dehalococcoidia bacterium]|nr:HEAT repeat domain-containing protein [Dehalococcoidia bacterium]